MFILGLTIANRNADREVGLLSTATEIVQKPVVSLSLYNCFCLNLILY